MESLERFGVFLDDSGSLVRLDAQAAFTEVRKELQLAFGYRPHQGAVEFTGPNEGSLTLRNLLKARQIPDDVINDYVKRQGEGEEIKGCATYIGDIDLGFVPRLDYIVFMSVVTPVAFFPLTLGEEVTHGEHICYVVDQGASYLGYKDRFHTLTEEVLGYIGRKRIMASAGLLGRYETEIELNQSVKSSFFAHMLAYYLVDDLNERGLLLPEKELFHAPDERVFWKILLGSVGEPVELNFIFPYGLRYEKLVPATQEILVSSKAEEAIKINFSYQY